MNQFIYLKMDSSDIIFLVLIFIIVVLIFAIIVYSCLSTNQNIRSKNSDTSGSDHSRSYIIYNIYMIDMLVFQINY